MATPPILAKKRYLEESLFSAENLLREARRQKSTPKGSVPRICVLDPDGDILRALLAERRAEKNPAWACYHTDLYDFEHAGVRLGIIGCAVGASFAVLLAEQLFVSGCELLISVTSSGQITPTTPPPYFVLIDKALRDEGTSYHYLPPAEFSHIDRTLLKRLKGAFDGLPVPVYQGGTWTTDAPFRETASAIKNSRGQGLLAVEMEAAALYAFAAAKRKAVVCLAHVTNQMARIDGDFEKGHANGSRDALNVIAATAKACAPRDAKAKRR
ncbi:MAG: nucleoside phosphorylase [Elusimicrobia bacterium]|nr:nucleoside phosphorylase [Elusimicrobiota bacterium]